MRNTIKKLERMPYAQAHVEIDPKGNIYLFSYKTLVVEITSDRWLSCFGLHSATTRRHIGAFMREYVRWPNGTNGDFYTAKRCYEGDFRLNLDTGEIEDLN